MKATTVDDEFERLRLPTPKLIKIDTEGAEELVLRGCSRLLSDRKVCFVIAELHEFGLAKMGGSQKTLRDLMEGLGYSTFGLYYDGSMPKLIPPNTKITMPCIINLLFSTQEAVARHWPTTFFIRQQRPIDHGGGAIAELAELSADVAFKITDVDGAYAEALTNCHCASSNW